MKPIQIGILREYKTPPDHRVAFLPEQLNNMLIEYPHIGISVEKSPVRCISDDEYTNAGFPVTDNLEHCDILFGIKEIPVEKLIPNKTYLFFSHTIKKQPRNKALLQAILEKNIKLIDYECLTDLLGARTVAFGHYAGIVGAYNGIRAFGLRTGLFNLQPASECRHIAIMMREYAKVKLPPIKIVVTGTGRVGKGVREVLDGMNISQVSPPDFLEKSFSKPVFTILKSSDYYSRVDGQEWDTRHFHQHPNSVTSTFEPFTRVADILMASAFWHPDSPVLFTKEQMRRPDFKIRTIADITCDIDGSVPSTLKASTIQEPFYDYNPTTGQMEAPFGPETNITVMAVDNLPCELPKDASFDFGNQLMLNVLPQLLVNDYDSTIERATITSNGNLMPAYQYLSDYAEIAAATDH